MNSNYNDNNVNVSFDSVSKAAFGIEDPNAERVPIDVAAFDRQREIRKERRLDAVKKRTTIKRAIVVASMVAVGTVGIGAVSKNLSHDEKIDDSSVKVEQQIDQVTYEDYVKYVQETNGTMSEEGYKNFIEQHNSSSRGGR